MTSVDSHDVIITISLLSFATKPVSFAMGFLEYGKARGRGGGGGVILEFCIALHRRYVKNTVDNGVHGETT